MPPVSVQRVTVRRVGLIREYLIWAVVFFVVALVAGVEAWSRDSFPVPSILVLLLLVLIGARGMSVGVTLSKDGLRITRMLGSRHIPFKEIRTFSYGRYESPKEVSRHAQVLICRTYAGGPQGGSGEVEIRQVVQRERNMRKTVNKLNAMLPNRTAPLREVPRGPEAVNLRGRHRTDITETD